MSARRVTRRSLVVCVVLLALAAPAAVGKPQPGTSTGTGRVFLPNPVAALQDQSLTDQKDADYAALQPAYRIVTLTNLDGSGYLRGDWANIRSETGAAGLLAGQHVPLRPRRRPLRAGDGLLLGDRGAEVHPEPGLRHHAPPDQHGIAGHPHQPVRHRQLVLVGQARRAALRQGRRGRRRRRRGDPARVRPRHAGLADDALRRLRDVGGSGLDRRGLRRLLGGHRQRRHRADARSGLRRRLGLGLLHRHAAPLPAPRRSGPALPAGPEWERASRRADLVARAVGHPRQLGHVRADTLILEAQFAFAPDTTMPAAAEATVNAALELYGSGVADVVRRRSWSAASRAG